MAAPSRGCYIIVSIGCFMVIPLGLLAPKVGPKLIDAWKFRKLGRPIPQRGRVVGYLWASGASHTTTYRLDLAGQATREWPSAGNCFAAELLANGNLLYPDGPQERLVELDPAGKTVWTSAAGVRLTNIFDLRRLANGHTLAVLGYNGGDGGLRVVELDRAGKAVWTHVGDQTVYSVERLANGNTLVAGPSGVQEVAPGGKAVWEKKERSLPDIIHARRLANGNTLIADWGANCVIEFDREGQELWRCSCECPMSAERLPDGQTLVAHRNPDELLLVAPDGSKRVLATGIAGGKAQPIYAGR